MGIIQLCNSVIWELQVYNLRGIIRIKQIDNSQFTVTLDSILEKISFFINHLQPHLLPSPIQAVLWRYKFSQLKGSSDDGKSKIKFLFQNQDNKAIEAKVTNLSDSSEISQYRYHICIMFSQPLSSDTNVNNDILYCAFIHLLLYQNIDIFTFQ